MQPATKDTTEDYFDVVIIGAGLSGIGAACQLTRKTSQKSYIILESRKQMGGTWDLFRYPGVRSDSDMHTLGYSFRPWKHEKSIADGASILNYICETAKEYDVGNNIRFGKRVEAVSWNSETAMWNISYTDSGQDARFIKCSFIYCCTGYYRYDKGYMPDFPGIEKFTGEVIHPQQWPKDFDYDDKRVVVIGSGATAITLVPSMARSAKHVTMLQRSPTYVISSPSIDNLAHKLGRLLPDKIAYMLIRWKNIVAQMILYRMSKRWPDYIRGKLLYWTKLQLGPNCDVGEHFSPSYKPWDQRLCLVPNGDLFKSLRNGSSSIVTDHIDHFYDEGIELKSGKSIEADIVVAATGLQLLALGGIKIKVDNIPVEVSDTTQYKGMMLSGVPNFFFATGYTNASWTLKCGLTSEYVCRLINHLDNTGQNICIARTKNAMLKRVMSIGLESGYVKRSIDKFPKEGVASPWKLHQNYFLDLIGLRFKSLKDGFIEFYSSSIK
jgi:cation diffusion facilitator CzcD-associated flavoprotein CzcO